MRHKQKYSRIDLTGAFKISKAHISRTLGKFFNFLVDNAPLLVFKSSNLQVEGAVENWDRYPEIGIGFKIHLLFTQLEKGFI